VPEGDSTRVEVGTDLTVTGKPAQFGRGMLADVSGKLIGQFAGCLAETLAATPAVVEPTEPAAVAEAEVEPIDLLKITGVAGAGRRYGPYVVVFAVVGVAAWLVVRWLRG
jgi:hypothetical protein